MADFTIRDATNADMPAIAAIYNYYVEKSTATWDLRPLSYQDQVAWMAGKKSPYCALVAEINGEVVAWGSLSSYRPKLGYRYTAEETVYVKAGFERQGMGTALLLKLVERAREAGFHSLLALISADNQVSIDLHLRHGFVEVGREKEVGFKFEQWLDLVTLQLML